MGIYPIIWYLVSLGGGGALISLSWVKSLGPLGVGALEGTGRFRNFVGRSRRACHGWRQRGAKSTYPLGATRLSPPQYSNLT